MQRTLLQLFYLLSAILFILGLRGLSHPRTARRGMFLAELGMLLAIVGTLFHHEILSYRWIVAGMVGLIVALALMPGAGNAFYLMVGLALLFGVLLILPIGAADMPVVIALLNSYAGLTDAAMGFMLDNKIQIITGSLDGSSGFILSILMCRAMNRSITNVLFGAFGKVQELPAGEEAKKPIRQTTVEEAAEVLGTARSIVFVPGYGMAVSQAQHRVRELADALKKKGVSVRYGIHAVAGRMPGHMNVLLAEANVPYDELYDMDQINPQFAETDVAVAVCANDVVNPAAQRGRGSPIYGMPILEVEKARVVIVCKRRMAPGFAGIDNELYYNENTLMLFGDAKETMVKLTAALKS